MNTHISQIQVERVVGLVLGWHCVTAARVETSEAPSWRVRARDIDGKAVRAVFDDAEIRRAIYTLTQPVALLQAA
jgi:hypothetical protein